MISDIPGIVQKHSIISLEKSLDKKITLQGFSFSGGGCINQGGRLSTSAGTFFIKWNSRSKYPAMFEAEASGLQLLKASSSIHIPGVVSWFEADDFQAILSEYVESKSKSDSYWENLGTSLASLHRNSNNTFGLDRSNYIGSLPQVNDPTPAWIDFFIEKRLVFQLKIAVDGHVLDKNTVRQFERLYLKLSSLLPIEKPSLLHGDLWSGNVIADESGQPCLIDPAVYYGHREAELAFTTLFGGFDDRFYRSYDEAYPLVSGYDKRIDLYNLYPLLVHVNLFGGGYIRQVKSILERFV
jgi:fructosamine-3-kinase